MPILLSSFHVLEHWEGGRNVWIWHYPNSGSPEVNLEVRVPHYLNLLNVKDENERVVHFVHYNSVWIYTITTHRLQKALSKIPRADKISLVLSGVEFNPEFYGAQASALLDAYLKSGDFDVALKLFLQFQTEKKRNNFIVSPIFSPLTFYKSPQISGIIRQFGEETILLYAAILLKKRILVYHCHTPTLFRFVKNLPALMLERDIWPRVFPWVMDLELDVENPENFYIAGGNEMIVLKKSYYADIVIRLAASEITVQTHSKDFLSCVRGLREMSGFVEFMELVGTETDIMLEIQRHTKELFKSLKEMCSEDENGKLCLDHPKVVAKNLSKNSTKFIKAFATTEDYF